MEWVNYSSPIVMSGLTDEELDRIEAMAKRIKETTMKTQFIGLETTPADHRTPEGKDRYERLGRLAEIRGLAQELATMAQQAQRLIDEPDRGCTFDAFADAFAAMKAALDTHTPMVEEMAREGQR